MRKAPLRELLKRRAASSNWRMGGPFCWTRLVTWIFGFRQSCFRYFRIRNSEESRQGNRKSECPDNGRYSSRPGTCDSRSDLQGRPLLSIKRSGSSGPPLANVPKILSLWGIFSAKVFGSDSPAPVINPSLRHVLLTYNWPGNVRELENHMRKLVIFEIPMRWHKRF